MVVVVVGTVVVVVDTDDLLVVDVVVGRFVVDVVAGVVAVLTGVVVDVVAGVVAVVDVVGAGLVVVVVAAGTSPGIRPFEPLVVMVVVWELAGGNWRQSAPNPTKATAKSTVDRRIGIRRLMGIPMSPTRAPCGAAWGSVGATTASLPSGPAPPPVGPVDPLASGGLTASSDSVRRPPRATRPQLGEVQ